MDLIPNRSSPIEITALSHQGGGLDDGRVQAQHELEVFLGTWAEIENGHEEEPGDIQTLWELLELLESCQPKELQKILNPLKPSITTNRKIYSDLKTAYACFKFNPAMYVIHSIFDSMQGKDKIREFEEARAGSELLRYKMEVVRDSFIWLTYLGQFRAGDFNMLFDDFDRSVQLDLVEKVGWLHKRNSKSGALSAAEEKDLEKLWRMFKEHKRLPALYVFSLARLRVKGLCLVSWAAFVRATASLVYTGTNIRNDKSSKKGRLE